MNKIIDKYRQEAQDFVDNHYLNGNITWRQSILETIFRPNLRVPGGKGPHTHLHPDSKNLHMPPGCVVSDWRKYKVEDHKALVNFQKRCHAAGLHDPWLRNYAFMFYPGQMLHKSRTAVITTGAGYGFCIALALYVGEKIYDQFYPTIYKHTPEYIEKYGTGEIHH